MTDFSRGDPSLIDRLLSRIDIAIHWLHCSAADTRSAPVRVRSNTSCVAPGHATSEECRSNLGTSLTFSPSQCGSTWSEHMDVLTQCGRACVDFRNNAASKSVGLTAARREQALGVANCVARSARSDGIPPAKLILGRGVCNVNLRIRPLDFYICWVKLLLLLHSFLLFQCSTVTRVLVFDRCRPWA